MGDGNGVSGAGEAARDGWRPDPFGAYELRLFRDGQPTPLVKDDGIGRVDPIPLDQRRIVAAPDQASISRVRGAPRQIVRTALALVAVGVVVAAVGVLDNGHRGPGGRAERPGSASASQTVPDHTLTSLEKALAALPRTTTLSQIEQKLLSLPKGPTATSVATTIGSLPPSTTVGQIEQALAALGRSTRAPSSSASRPRGAAPPGHAPLIQAPSKGSPGSGASGGAQSPTSPGTAPASGGPTSSHRTPRVMVVMMENESSSSVVGNPQMPFTNSLVNEYGYASQSFAVNHPSLPDYLAITSGQNPSNSIDDGPPANHTYSIANLGTQLSGAGIPEKAYAENLPGNPSADAGGYAVRHLPWVYYTNNVMPIADPGGTATSWPTMVAALNSVFAPDFVWFTPNLVDDEHDGTPGQTDAFLSHFISAVQGTSWYANGGQVIVEYDEGADSDTSGINGGVGGHVPTIVVSAALRLSPKQTATPVDTVGILHSIEDLYGLPHLGGSSADGSLDSLLSQ